MAIKLINPYDFRIVRKSVTLLLIIKPLNLRKLRVYSDNFTNKLSNYDFPDFKTFLRHSFKVINACKQVFIIKQIFDQK